MTQTQSRVTFSKAIGFRKELNNRVEDYFLSNNIKPRDNPAMYFKTFVILTWLICAWAFTVFVPAPLVFKALGCVILGLAIAAVGMSIGHDANHGGYSSNPAANKVLGLTYDFIGLSSYLWRFRHNFLHHTYTNILGHDVEIHGDGLVRMTPQMEYKQYHRFQHLFIWFIYPLIPIYWSIGDIHLALFKRRYHEHIVPKLQSLELVTLIGLKLLGIFCFIGIPIVIGHPPLLVIAGGLIAYGVYGLVVCTIFMLAHVLEPAEFIEPHPMTNSIDDEWAIFQVKTTVDFAPKNPLVNWYVGGLNYQAVHHLFPHVCHIHYPKIAPILADVCQEFGIQYSVYETFRGALAANYRWLKQMSVKPRVSL